MSQEYVDTLIDWLEEWRKESSSFCVFQFLARYNIGWNLFKRYLKASERLNTAFETTLAWLADRWFDFGMKKDKLPKHQQALMEYYIKRYDLREWEKEIELRKDIAVLETQAAAKYVIEEWGQAELDGRFKEIYDKNERS